MKKLFSFLALLALAAVFGINAFAVDYHDNRSESNGRPYLRDGVWYSLFS